MTVENSAQTFNLLPHNFKIFPGLCNNFHPHTRKCKPQSFFVFHPRPRSYQNTCGGLQLRKPGGDTEEPAAPSSPSTGRFLPQFALERRVLRLAFCSLVSLICRFSGRSSSHGIPHLILAKTARSPLPAAPISSLPRHRGTALAEVPFQPPAGPGPRSSPAPTVRERLLGTGAAKANWGPHRALLPRVPSRLGSPSSTPYLRSPDHWSKQLWLLYRTRAPVQRSPRRPAEAPGSRRSSPTSACGASCRRGVLSETLSPSLGGRPRTGDLMTPPGSWA